MAVGGTFEAEVWEWDGPAAWHFVSLPEPLADEIDEWHGSGNAFGSVRVEAVIGRTTWRTSLFPDTKRGTYLLPVKQQVRKAEGLAAGARTTVTVSVLAPPPGSRTVTPDG